MLMKSKILIASSSFYRFPTKALEAVAKVKKKYQVIDNPYKRRMDKNELLKAADGCVGIIAGLEEYDTDLLEKLSNSLGCISRDGVGMDNINLKAAEKYGITVCNTALAATDAVAELTLGLVIALLRGLPSLDRDTHHGKWVQTHGNLLSGKTVGIIGMGNIGKRVAQLLVPFNCHILGNDLKPDLKWFKKNHIVSVSKKQLFKKSDVVTLHPSYFLRNYHLINAGSFTQMKKGVIFLNLSRGPIVAEGDLVRAIRSGKIAAAALDVFEKEPYTGPLAEMSNVILTPHIGASTYESRYQMQLGAINNLIKYLENEKIRI